MTMLHLLPAILVSAFASFEVWRVLSGITPPPLWHPGSAPIAAGDLSADSFEADAPASGSDVFDASMADDRPRDNSADDLPLADHLFAQRPRETVKKPRSLAVPFALVALYNLVALVVVWQQTAAVGLTPDLVYFGLISQAITLAVLAAVVSWTRSTPPRTTALSTARLVGVGIASGLASLAPALVIGIAFEGFRMTADHPLISLLKTDAGAGLWPAVIMTAVIFAPMIEELEFRLIMQTFLARRLGRAWAFGTIVVWFSAIHGPFNALQIVPIAIALGVLFNRTQSYLAVVVGHATFNASMLGLLALTIHDAAAGA